MVKENFSSRSIINRAYYGMFYAILALFIKKGIHIQTSKHTGVITIFDKEFVKSGKIDKKYSKILHNIFDERQEADYRELVDIPFEKAIEYVNMAKDFFNEIKKITAT
ncbi:MAG: HEPN domain-containing protein [Brevinematales bacterium]